MPKTDKTPEKMGSMDAAFTTTPYAAFAGNSFHYFASVRAMDGFTAKKPGAPRFVLDRATGEWNAL